MTAINLADSPSNGDTATVNGATYTYNSSNTRWEVTAGAGSSLTTEQVQDIVGDQLTTNGSHTGISFAYDDSGDAAIDATVGTLNQNTTGSAATLTTPREINGVAFNGSADITIPAGNTVYATLALLTAATGMSTGDMAYVTANNKLYLYTGSGWFLVATVQNNSPTAITGVASTVDLAKDGTATTITAVSTDPDGYALTWSYAVTTGSLTNGGGATATVSQADNVFTITPTTTTSYGGEFSITFSASDGTNTATAESAFTLVFAYNWSSTTQQQKIVASDAQAGDYFGRSAAISGDTVVVAAYGEDTTAGGAGAAYIFTRSGTTWSQQQKIQASDAQAGDNLGYSVGIDGDTLVVGAHKEDNTGGADAGAAYIFTRSGTTWSQQAKLTASDAQATDYFGWSVAIDGDTVVVGAYYEDAGGGDAGAAYIFTRSGTTWSQQAKLTASDAQATDYFGISAAISGDTVVVGAYQEDTGGSKAGAAYVFTRSGTTWSQQQKIQASDKQAGDYFGRSAAISGDTVVVGAYREDTTASDAGAAYIFTRSGTTWSQQQKIQASDAQASDNFGISAAISGDIVVVGSYVEDTTATDAGAAYIFTRSGTTWSQDKKIQASDAQASDNLGYSLGIDGDTVVVGAHKEDYWGTDAGAAYIFTAPSV
jgi:hypothetical protein